MKIVKKKTSHPQLWEKGHLSFMGGGFTGIYGVGVAVAFKEFAPQIAARKTLGASSGALTAATLAAEFSVYEAISSIVRMAVHCRSFTLRAFSPRLNLHGIMREDLNKIITEHGRRRSCGKLFVSLTRVAFLRNEVISDFKSCEDLADVLLASCTVPYIFGAIPPQVRGVRYVDGGITDNMPVHDENTITVSAFSGYGCIRPESTSSFSHETICTENFIRAVQVLFAPPPKVLEEFIRAGYKDALRFIQDHDLYACSECAKLPCKPRRGDCSKCEILSKLANEAEIHSSYCEPMRRAQQAEDARIQANPFQYAVVMKALYALMALIYWPIETVSLAAINVHQWCML